MLDSVDNISLFEFIKTYFIGDLPFGFDWVYVFIGVLIIVLCLLAFFRLIDVRSWFK